MDRPGKNLQVEDAKENPNEEVVAIEKAMNAFFFYKKYGQEKILHMLQQIRKIPNEHQILIGESYKSHIKELNERLEANFTVLKTIVNYSVGMFGEASLQAARIHQSRRPSADYMSKVMSTIRQIVREWSSCGAEEREATYTPIVEHLNGIFPEASNRHEIRILVPGSGLGRLAFDLMHSGYSVQGNEFSLFMLLTSCFLLNACKTPNQFTIYPFIFDKSNSWSFEDQLRAVKFPDCCPDESETARKNSFSMSAGDFLEVARDVVPFDAVVTAWFIDTAHNIVAYIEHIYRSLKPGGVWINVGPLTYHFEDMKDENSIELPYDEVLRIVRAQGFEVCNERRIDSKYTTNRMSMLQHQYTCAYFVAKKP